VAVGTSFEMLAGVLAKDPGEGTAFSRAVAPEQRRSGTAEGRTLPDEISAVARHVLNDSF